MTFGTNPFELPHHPAAELDVKPELFDDLDSSLIDSNMLSGTTMERKDSFATTASTFFSPQSSTNPWGEEPFSIPTSAAHHDRHMSMSSQMADPVIGSNNPFLNHQNFSWPVYARSNEVKPSMASAFYEPFATEFEPTSSAAFQPPVSTASPFGGATTMLANVRPAAIMPPSADVASLSTSPPPHPAKEWMALAEQDMDTGRLPKRMRQNSPPRPLTPGFARRDGVRKKNARFEIPEGRNLHNIDRLISQASTEEDVKELKQQKRLLRNRQAALDSRQRKKKHTEELEKEQKVWLDHRSDMETKICILQEEFDALKMHVEQVEQQRDELSNQVHVLTHEQESMVEAHTLETGNLRKRITTLTERLERSPATVHSHSSNGFSDIDLDQLTMENEWESMIFDNMVDDDELEPEPSSTNKASNTTTLVLGKPRKDTIMEDMPQLASGGFLLMLLLYGAIVASKAGTNAPPMPGMSDEMRAVSAHIVDDILKDGSSASQSSLALTSSRIMGMQPAPSMPAWIQPDTTADRLNSMHLNIMSTPSRAASRLDSMTSNLMTSSKLAEDEAAFGLTAEQYNSMTSSDYTPRRTYLPDEGNDVLHSTGRRTLGEALRQMRDEAGGRPVSEVYTRSLLGERIPDHVLRDFRKLVEEGRAEKARGTRQL